MSFIKKRFRSFSYAFKGIFHAFHTQPNIRIHTLAAILAMVTGIFLEISRMEWLFIIIAIGIVFTTEIINSSIEKLVDMVSPERQEKAGNIKDMAAGAVLIASLTALIIGCIIFIPKILHLFFICSV
jgi:diacylglycerol kinase (ATP)